MRIETLQSLAAQRSAIGFDYGTALRKAIAAGEAKQSAIVETQRKLSVAGAERDQSLHCVHKKAFFVAAQQEYGESDEWDEHTWQQVLTDLTPLADWVKAVK